MTFIHKRTQGIMKSSDNILNCWQENEISSFNIIFVVILKPQVRGKAK